MIRKIGAALLAMGAALGAAQAEGALTVSGEATDIINVEGNRVATIAFKTTGYAEAMAFALDGACISVCEGLWMLLKGNFGPDASFENVVTGGSFGAEVAETPIVVTGGFEEDIYFLVLEMQDGRAFFKTSRDARVSENGILHLGLYEGSGHGHVGGFRRHEPVIGASMLFQMEAR